MKERMILETTSSSISVELNISIAEVCKEIIKVNLYLDKFGISKSIIIA